MAVRKRSLMFFQDNRSAETPLGEGVPKGTFCIFVRIATKLGITISSDKRRISTDLHDNRYILRDVRAKKGP